jgi:cytochrome c553
MSKSTFKAKAEIRKLDKFCREIVFARDKSTCRRCGKGRESAQIHWCHIFSRGAKSVRWDLTNSLAMCAGCHFWAHHNPTLFTAFVLTDVLPDAEVYASLVQRAAKPRPLSPDVVEVWWSYLSDEAQKYGISLP